jgi:membrane protease YdiL (CAAX protease family)
VERTILEAAGTAGLMIALALPAVFRRKGAYFLLFAAIALAAAVVVRLPRAFPALAFPGGHWNWTGKTGEFVLLLIAVIALVATGKLSRRETGLTFRHNKGSLVPVLAVSALFTTAFSLLVWFFFPPHSANAETLAFQASLPGLTEELAYRGVLLALLDRMFTGRIRLLGAEFGWGAVVVTLGFGFIHGFSVQPDLTATVSWYGLAYPTVVGFGLVWLRARSGSLVMPLVLHNGLNVLINLIPAFH